jgi:MFS family permease
MTNSTAIMLKSIDSNSNDTKESRILDTDSIKLPKLNETSNACSGNLLSSGKTIVNDYGVCFNLQKSIIKFKGSIEWDANVQGWLFSASFYGALIALIPAGILADCLSPRLLLSFSAITSILSSATLPYLALNWGPSAVFVSMFVMGLGEVLDHIIKKAPSN